jgi:hypothetical protein
MALQFPGRPLHHNHRPACGSSVTARAGRTRFPQVLQRNCSLRTTSPLAIGEARHEHGLGVHSVAHWPRYLWVHRSPLVGYTAVEVVHGRAVLPAGSRSVPATLAVPLVGWGL